jgi:hypothetical protein
VRERSSNIAANQEVVEHDREELEIILRGSDEQAIQNALLSAAYYDPDWKWVQSQCLALTLGAD